MSWYRDFRSFTDALNPLADDLYKVILSLDALKPLLDQYVAGRIDYLDSLTITTQDNRLVLQGHYILTSGLWKGQRIAFAGFFQVADARDNIVILRIKKVELSRVGTGKIDWIRMFSFALPGLKHLLVRALTEAQPDIFNQRHYREVHFNTPYFLHLVPALVNSLGQIRIVFVRAAAANQVHFYVQSNQIIRNLMEYFGPEYLSAENIQFDQESLAMLWQEKD